MNPYREPGKVVPHKSHVSCSVCDDKGFIFLHRDRMLCRFCDVHAPPPPVDMARNSSRGPGT